MDLLNNWLVQVIIGNIAWILFCKIAKSFKNYFKLVNENNTKKTSNNYVKELYPKELLKKQFNISFKVSSVSTVTLLVILANNLQYKFPCLFVLLIIFDFFCYLFMLGAFEGATDYFNK